MSSCDEYGQQGYDLKRTIAYQTINIEDEDIREVSQADDERYHETQKQVSYCYLSLRRFICISLVEDHGIRLIELDENDSRLCEGRDRQDDEVNPVVEKAVDQDEVREASIAYADKSE